jgi:hypothetical protein
MSRIGTTWQSEMRKLGLFDAVCSSAAMNNWRVMPYSSQSKARSGHCGPRGPSPARSKLLSIWLQFNAAKKCIEDTCRPKFWMRFASDNSSGTAFWSVAVLFRFSFFGTGDRELRICHPGPFIGTDFSPARRSCSIKACWNKPFDLPVPSYFEFFIIEII